METVTVYVNSDNDQFDADDYTPREDDDSKVKREAPCCDKCEMVMNVDFEEPIAWCDCTQMEWYK
jgi:hypothetical protein